MAIVPIPKGTTDLSTVTLVDNDEPSFGEGGQTVTTNINFSALTTGFTNVWVNRRFTGNIGTAGTPFRADVDSAASSVLDYNAASGSMYFYPGGGSSVANNVWHRGGGELNLCVGGTVTEYQQRGRSGNISSDVTVTNIRLFDGSLEQLYKSSGTTTNAELWINGGTFTSGRGATGDVYVTNGATAMFAKEDTQLTNLPTITGGGKILRISSASVKWIGSTITTLHLLDDDAFIDLADVPAAITIATVLGSSKAIARSGLPTVSGGTVTTRYGVNITVTTVAAYGGRVAEFAQWGNGNV